MKKALHNFDGFTRRLMLGSMLVAASSLALPFNATEASAAGSITVAQPQDPQNLDPIDTFLVAWGSIGSNFFEGLTFRDENLDLKPGLATSWEFRDNDTRVRFKLREGVQFHNGEPFNAEAVKFTFDRLLGDEGAKGPQRSNYTSIGSVEIVDDYTVDFKLVKSDPVLLTKLAGYGAMIVPPKYTSEVSPEEFDKAPVGTGPFKVVGYTPATSLQLERFDGYWGEKAKLDSVEVRFIPEQATRVSEVLSGGVDIAQQIPTSAASSIEDGEQSFLSAVAGPTIQYVRFKLKDAVTDDVRVRRAINMAIDKNAIVSAILGGHGAPIASLQSEMSFGYSAELKGYSYDPAAAQKLLKEAGVKPGTTLTLDLRNNNDTFKEVAQAISSYLSLVGLNVKLRTHETGVYISEIIPKGQTGELYESRWGGWTFDFDNTAYLLYHTGERWTPYLSDEKLDAMLEEQRSTYDQAKREKILQDIAAYAHDEALDIPLYSLSTLYGVNDRVKGFVPAPDNRLRFATISVD